MKLTDDMLRQHAAEAREQWLSTLPQRDEVPEHEFSGKFNRKMNKLIKEQRRTPRMRHVMRYVRRTAVFAPVLMIVIFSGLMTVETYRTAVIDIVTKQSVEYPQPDSPADVGTGDSADMGTDDGNTDTGTMIGAPTTAFSTVSFGYLPDGMTEAESQRVQYDDYRCTYFENADGIFFSLTETLISEEDEQPIPDTENAVVTHLNIMGEDAVLIEKDDENTIVWMYHQVWYTLYGNISSSELQKIARNIKLE